MAEEADSGSRRKRRLGVVMGRRAVREESQRIKAARAKTAAARRLQNR